MSIPSKLFPIRIPEPLLRRAKLIVIERNMKGGVARLICDSLEATLDAMERVPVKFEAAWLREKGTPATDQEKVTCYGGRHPGLPKLGTPNYGPRDWFTLTELREHYFTSTWDIHTAALIYRQQQVWLTQGKALVRMPLAPPGWREYPQPRTSATDHEQNDDIE